MNGRSVLIHRLFSGALVIAVLAGLIYSDARYTDGGVVAGVLAVLAAVGSIELTSLTRKAGRSPLTTWPAIMSIVVVLLPYLHAAQWLRGDPAIVGRWTIAVLSLALVGAFALVSARRETEGAIADMAVSLLGVIYLGLLGQYIVALRLPPRGSTGVLVYFLATVKAGDIGAYFIGSAIGRHKLIAWLSPKKTWEGVFGAVLFSTAVALGGAWWFGPESIRAVRGLPDLRWACLFGVVMALAGHAGDLLESLYKRDAGVKDSGAVLPAFGGVLDLLDSVLVAAPFACWLLIE